ncbi:MAG: tRNA uridine-5-carboxymethylaminomethyl(34) synthesis GTPase MnmE [Phycisphaerales bacterium]|nr:tRNA uridine-5-carboxymethylaminomethyl(34) synthesis GTPase MnmE [Phycisphaerales bacterium]
MNPSDTIVAVSSAVGPAARMIVRMAGPDAFRLLGLLSPGLVAAPSVAARATLRFDGVHCPAWAYTFVGPNSYTGDDLAELHLPGNPLLARTLVEHLIAAGARSAEAGEFTGRAFLNGRMDLAEAEGVAMTIAATHAGELRAARQLVAGELSRRLVPPLEWLTEALSLIESNLDFSEDDIAFIDAGEVRRRVDRAAAVLDDLTRNAAQFERLAGEPTFVLVGLPNAGKSTLLNALAGGERAVVSPVAGTTRDALSAEVALRRGLIRVIDVAGIERAGTNEIDQQMQAQAGRAVEAADFVIEVRELGSTGRAWLAKEPDLLLRSKLDLAPGDARVGANEIAISAITNVGMDVLRQRMDDLAFGATSEAGTLALTTRHRMAVAAAHEALLAVAAILDDAPEMMAEQLRRAVDALGQVLGRVTPDDVLGRVFATFCVGK